jgi:hypothetical protein
MPVSNHVGGVHAQQHYVPPSKFPHMVSPPHSSVNRDQGHGPSPAHGPRSGARQGLQMSTAVSVIVDADADVIASRQWQRRREVVAAGHTRESSSPDRYEYEPSTQQQSQQMTASLTSLDYSQYTVEEEKEEEYAAEEDEDEDGEECDDDTPHGDITLEEEEEEDQQEPAQSSHSVRLEKEEPKVVMPNAKDNQEEQSARSRSRSRSTSKNSRKYNNNNESKKYRGESDQEQEEESSEFVEEIFDKFYEVFKGCGVVV